MPAVSAVLSKWVFKSRLNSPSSESEWRKVVSKLFQSRWTGDNKTAISGPSLSSRYYARCPSQVLKCQTTFCRYGTRVDDGLAISALT